MMSKRDYDALMSGKQLLENNQYTTPIGRSIDLVSGKWNGNRAVVALYEASNIIDISNKEAVNDYIMESSIFLNRLNEKCHIDGYHFDMDDDESGKIYFGKDIEDNSIAYNSSEDEITYSQEAAYFTYLRNKDMCQQRVNRMIEESLILTDDQMAISEKVDSLISINEGITDKVEDAWNKFKNFINKIWNKFLEFISRTVNSDKNYLEKYKEIILKREYKASDFDVDDDYNVGIHNISTFQIWSPNVQEVNQIPDADDDATVKKVQVLVMKGYANNQNQDFSEYCKTYFKGGTGKSFTYDKGTIRMASLFDYCYNYDKIKRSIEKNKGIMDKAGNTFIELAKQAATQQNPSPQQQKPTISGDTEITITNATVDGQGKATVSYTYKDSNNQDVTASAEFSTTLNSTNIKTTFTGKMKKSELDTLVKDNTKTQPSSQGQASVQGSASVLSFDATTKKVKIKFKDAQTDEEKIISTTATSEDEAKTKLAGKNITTYQQFQALANLESVFDINGSLGLISIREKATSGGSSSDTSGIKINTTASNYGNASSGSNMVRSRAGIVKANNGADINTEDMEKLTKRVHRYTSVASTVFAAILTAAETIKKDFMTIIKAHVRSYVGETDEERREGKIAAGSPEAHNISLNLNIAQVNSFIGEINGFENAYKNVPDTDQNKINAANAIINKVQNATAVNGVPSKSWDNITSLKSELETIQATLTQNAAPAQEKTEPETPA